MQYGDCTYIASVEVDEINQAERKRKRGGDWDVEERQGFKLLKTIDEKLCQLETIKTKMLSHGNQNGFSEGL
jgi:hypothetical protein